MSSLTPDLVVKNRYLGFLIWQSIPSTIVYCFFKTLISAFANSIADSEFSNSRNSTSFRKNPLLWPFVPSFIGFVSFITFHLSQLLFSSALSAIASPQPERPASLLELATGLVRFLYVPGGVGSGDGQSQAADSGDFRRRVKISLSFVLFVAASAASGFTASVSLCGVRAIREYDDGFWVIGRVGLRGFLVGFLFGSHYVYKRRWILEFPIIQVSL